MSRWPVEYSAAWLLSYDQAMTAEDHKICQAAPDFGDSTVPEEMVKQMPGRLDLLCCERCGERDFDGCLTQCA